MGYYLDRERRKKAQALLTQLQEGLLELGLDLAEDPNLNNALVLYEIETEENVGTIVHDIDDIEWRKEDE